MVQQIRSNKANSFCRLSRLTFIISFIVMFVTSSIVINTSVVAQDHQSLEFGEQSEPDNNNNNGPEIEIQIPLLHNFNNPNDNVFTDFFPLNNVTITIFNRPNGNGGFLYGYSQNTGVDNPPVVMGWEVNPDGETASGIVPGSETQIVVPFTALDESIADPDLTNRYVDFTGFDPGLDDIEGLNLSEMESHYSSTEGTTGLGIDFIENRNAFISAAFEGLKLQEEDYQVNGSGEEFHLADLTIEFDHAINKPIIHLFGLGGFWEYEDVFEVDVNGVTEERFIKFINAATVELEFINAFDINDDAIPNVEMDIRSGNPGRVGADFDGDGFCVPDDPENVIHEFGLGIDGNRITNTWNIPFIVDTEFSDCDDSGVAQGSIMFEGLDAEEEENIKIKRLEFELWVRAPNNVDAFTALFEDLCLPGDEFDICIAGSNAFGWGGGVNGFEFTYIEDDVSEENYTINIPDYNIAHDLFTLGVSSDVDPDDTELTISECYRMLSTPVAGTSYGDLVGNFWIQGQGITGDGVNWTGPEVDPNIFTWPVTEEGTDPGEWQELGSLNTTIPSGTGFLISVFEDDIYGEPCDPDVDPGCDWPKPISVTGSEPEPFLFTDMNQNNLGWTLLGNPYKEPIDFEELLGVDGDTQGIEGVAYIFDRNRTPVDGDDDFGIGDLGGDGDYSGGWVTTTVDGYGDILDGLISPFQGFFVQTETDGPSPQVDFQDRDRITGTGGEFYGKEKQRQNFVRLEVIGDGVFNSSWIRFSDQGSFETTRGDALELMPMTANYAIFGTRKLDGTLMDIGHYPTPDEETEIILGFETTKSGNFILRATDFDLSYATDLYLVDTEKGESIRIDENFKYEFTVNQAAKSVNEGLTSCAVGPQKAQTVTSGNRFLITTQPRETESTLPDAVALNQNYPNPFNPTTQITYELPQQTDVRLTVYDMVGRQVATLVNETVQAGVHNVNFDASSLSSGVYIYRLQAGSSTLSRKLTVIK